VTVAGCDVSISNPQKILFPQAGCTKLDLILSCAEHPPLR
jgi:DNA primase